jgi:hypothetical protein
MLQKSAVNAGMVVAGSYLSGHTFSSVALPFLGDIPFWAFMGLIGVTTSLAIDVTHTMILDHIPINMKSESQKAMFLGSIVGAGVMVGSLYVISPNLLDQYGLFTAVLVGAGTEIASSFAYGLLF